MSIPGIKQCLKREFPKTPDMETVIDTVCNRLDVTKEEILESAESGRLFMPGILLNT